MPKLCLSKQNSSFTSNFTCRKFWERKCDLPGFLVYLVSKHRISFYCRYWKFSLRNEKVKESNENEIPQSDLVLYTVRAFLPSFRKISSKNGLFFSSNKVFLDSTYLSNAGFLWYYLSSERILILSKYLLQSVTYWLRTFKVYSGAGSEYCKSKILNKNIKVDVALEQKTGN